MVTHFAYDQMQGREKQLCRTQQSSATSDFAQFILSYTLTKFLLQQSPSLWATQIPHKFLSRYPLKEDWVGSCSALFQVIIYLVFIMSFPSVIL